MLYKALGFNWSNSIILYNGKSCSCHFNLIFIELGTQVSKHSVISCRILRVSEVAETQSGRKWVCKVPGKRLKPVTNPLGTLFRIFKITARIQFLETWSLGFIWIYLQKASRLSAGASLIFQSLSPEFWLTLTIPDI